MLELCNSFHECRFAGNMFPCRNSKWNCSRCIQRMETLQRTRTFFVSLIIEILLKALCGNSIYLLNKELIMILISEFSSEKFMNFTSFRQLFLDDWLLWILFNSKEKDVRCSLSCLSSSHQNCTIFLYFYLFSKLFRSMRSINICHLTRVTFS